MRQRRLIKHLLPLPISSYLIGFFTVATLMFGLTTAWMTHKSEEITRLASEERQQAAQQEMVMAMQRIDGNLLETISRLKQWDELYQQLGDATFYEYWLSSRALQAGYTPNYVQAIELYDASGNALRSGHDNQLPSQRPLQYKTIRMENGLPYLYQFSEIVQRGSSTRLIGYLGIKIDFHQALLSLNRFSYVDATTISYSHSGHGIFASSDELLANTRFTTLTIAETEQLEQLMEQTMLRLALLSLLLLVVAYWLTSYLLHTPLRRLSTYIEDLRTGKASKSEAPVSKTLCITEFEVLRNSIVSYQKDLEQMHFSLDQKNQELWKLSTHDALTGVPNRRAYEEDWNKLQKLLRGQQIVLSVLLIDCDHFKAINDSYGHDVGDRVIQGVAACLLENLREGDHLYRIGGNEFAIHLLNTSARASQQYATHCQQSLEQYDFRSLGIREPLRFSMALASASGEEHSSLNLLHKHADIAMYHAKRPGTGKIVTYSPEMATTGEAISSNRYINAVYQAVESGKGIELHFQPVIAAENGCEGFHEVLLRLRDDQGMITPNNIFPVVEREGLAVDLDFAIIRQLAGQLQRTGSQGTYSINIDGETLMHHDFMEHIGLLRDHLRRRSRGIILEITETALISELKEAGQRLNQLREDGFYIALDDFGSGYSSLRYLSSMPVDIVKFDINMVRDLAGDKAQAEITGDLARMIRRSGYYLVAEGIESEELLEQVRGLGFSHVQGFLFGRPEAETVVEEKLRL